MKVTKSRRTVLEVSVALLFGLYHKKKIQGSLSEDCPVLSLGQTLEKLYPWDNREARSLAYGHGWTSLL